MASIDFSKLPAPAVVETLSFEDILAERKADLISRYAFDTEKQEQIAATLELESEPLTKLLEENAYREMIWRARVNNAAVSVMVGFATSTDLDQLAANVNLTRLITTPADNTVIPAVEEELESDEELRARIVDSYEGLSVAGPAGSYEFHARSADGRVLNVKAISPSPAVVTVSILARAGNGQAPADLIEIVNKALNGEDVRPVADRVTVKSAEIVNYSIDAVIYIYPGPEAEPIRQAAISRLQAYIAAQKKIGRDINRSALFAAIHVEGVQRVQINAPAADIVISDTQAAFCTGYNITIGGTDE